MHSETIVGMFRIQWALDRVGFFAYEGDSLASSASEYPGRGLALMDKSIVAHNYAQQVNEDTVVLADQHYAIVGIRPWVRCWIVRPVEPIQ